MPLKRLQAGKHTCFGSIGSKPVSVQDSDNQLERPALLVYVGKFQSMDGEVEVTEEHIDRLVGNHNAKLSRLKRLVTGELPIHAAPPLQLDHSSSATATVGRIVGEIRKGEHEDENTGLKVPALYADRIRVLGTENVAKVLDGRWIHLSIGADLDEGKLNEVSITPFPAAANASLQGIELAVAERGSVNGVAYTIEYDEEMGKFVLYMGGKTVGSFDSREEARKAAKAEKLSKGNESMKLTEILKNLFRLSSDKEADEKADRLKKHLMDTSKCTAEDAEKKLSEMDDDGKKKLSEEADEAMKKLSAADDEKKDEKVDDKLAGEEKKDEKLTEEKVADEKLAEKSPAAGTDLDTEEKDEPEHKKEVQNLSASPAGTKLSVEQKAAFVKLAGGLRKTAKNVQLESRKAVVSSRLSALRASAKITPAEVKKIDIARLAAENDATIAAVFKTYEEREPVILAGILGSAKAENLAQLSTRLKSQELEKESRSNMPFLKQASMAKGEESETTRLSSEKVSEPAGAVDGSHYKVAYEEVSRMMDSGDVSGARLALKALFDKLSGGRIGEEGADIGAKAMSTQMSSLAEDVKSLHNQFEDLVRLIGPNLGVESAELE